MVGLIRVGGLSGLIDKYSYAIASTTIYTNTSCGLPAANYFDLYRRADGDFPWPGMTFGIMILGTWCWCSDQMIVQRALAAKNLSHAKGACVLAGYLKILPFFLIIVPGMISRVLFSGKQSQVKCLNHHILTIFIFY